MNAGDGSEGRLRFVGRVRELITIASVERFGAVRSEVPIEGFRLLTRTQLDDPLAGVRAADWIAGVAETQRLEYAREARAAGRSWDAIGEALDLPAEGGCPRGEAAFDWLVEGRAPDPAGPADGLFREPSTYWRCAACGQLVTDHGPCGSHPDDIESGHADGCSRHAAEIAAWAKRTGWDE